MGRADDVYDERYEEGDAADGGWYGDPRDARPMALVRRAYARFAVIAPACFEDAQTVAERLRDDSLVVVDLRGCSPGLAGRLADFCSGLVYALDGSVQDVADGVLLLTPDHVDVSGDETAGARPPGFFNRC